VAVNGLPTSRPSDLAPTGLSPFPDPFKHGCISISILLASA
jgi:hypothetical protein